MSSPLFFFRGPTARRANLNDRSEVPSWWQISDGDVLRISQTSDSIVVEAVITYPEPLVLKTRLKQGQDYVCEAGEMLLTPERAAGYADGSQQRFDATEVVGKLADGSIFAHRKTFATATSAFVFRAERRTDSFYRLLPLIPSR